MTSNPSVRKSRTSAAGSCVVSRSRSTEIEFIRSLYTVEGRQKSGLFVAEGVRALVRAVQQNAPIVQMFVAPDLLTSPAGQRVVKHLRIAGTPCMRLTDDLFRSLSHAEEPQGIAAVIRQQWHTLDAIQARQGLCWLAVDSIRNGGNLGAMIRTCEAVGAGGVILIGSTSDLYNPATVRATMGALFSLKFVHASVSEFVRWKVRTGCTVVGAALDGARDYRQASYPAGTVLLMGCERTGLSPELARACDRLVKIPMVGASDSLNVGVAAGIILYEIFHQRRSSETTEDNTTPLSK